MPKTGIEPISKSYKESVLPIKLYRLISIEFLQLGSSHLAAFINYNKIKIIINKKKTT
jgi:hypothetical protein